MSVFELQQTKRRKSEVTGSTMYGRWRRERVHGQGRGARRWHERAIDDRFQIGKVYCREQPAIVQGRMQEFYQCDFDYVLEALQLHVAIGINSRLILDGIFSAFDVPKDLIRSISSAVNKLDKMPRAEVKKEVEGKGLGSTITDRLGGYLLQDKDTVWKLPLHNSDPLLSANEDLDFSLARGLDYYTGRMYEEVMENANSQLLVGSIAAGGQYYNLTGMFSKHNDIPCVGSTTPSRNHRGFQCPRKSIDVAEKSVVVVVFLEEDADAPGLRGMHIKFLILPDRNIETAAVVDRNEMVDEVKKGLA
ncbi:hypothetical protein EJ02DRAFT_504879 [Clathrospora elynae]|uniref:Uncharacterized protein n=1 Tax=Clathrospora elynae TaxID=706981 RepID=A0A6A5SHF3_9PLEO|nr:hypothetical protein EJ02DRAFT_504879 [Clathrospora elynae]